MNFHADRQIHYLKRYFQIFFRKEIQGWLKFLLFFNIYMPLGICFVIGIVIYINPFAPSTAYLAIGQDGSSYQKISENFEKFFHKNNIKLELVSTKGLSEGLKGLQNEASRINASFLTVGFSNAQEYPDLVSLGSVQFAPIWIFYKGPEVKTDDPFQYLSGKKISIGLPDEVTNTLYRKLSSVSSEKPITNALELSHKDGADALIKGEIDALFIVDGIQSETVKSLLNDTDIKIMSFTLADAYIKQLPFLQKLVIPRGSRSITKVEPPQDITILASTTNLLVEKNTHPAIQWAFLLAARENNRDSNTFFSVPNLFPKDIDRSFELSPVARQFFENGVPSIFSYMPIWIASLIDSIWIYILACFALIFPALRWAENARLYPSEVLMNKTFINLRVLNDTIAGAATKEEIERVLTTAKEFEKMIDGLYLYGKNARFHFNLRNALAGLNRDAQARLEQLKTLEIKSKSSST